MKFLFSINNPNCQKKFQLKVLLCTRVEDSGISTPALTSTPAILCYLSTQITIHYYQTIYYYIFYQLH